MPAGPCIPSDANHRRCFGFDKPASRSRLSCQSEWMPPSRLCASIASRRYRPVTAVPRVAHAAHRRSFSFRKTDDFRYASRQTMWDEHRIEPRREGPQPPRLARRPCCASKGTKRRDREPVAASQSDAGRHIAPRLRTQLVRRRGRLNITLLHTLGSRTSASGYSR